MEALTPFDLLLAVVLIAGLPLWSMRSWRRLHRAIRADDPCARLTAYRRVVVVQWSLVALLAVHWVVQGHAFASLGLDFPLDLRVLGAFLVSGALGMLVHGQASTALADAETRREARGQITDLRPMLPHTPDEYSWFRPVAWTAGICEEILYRGYLPWLFALYTDDLAAFGVATLVFGLGHAYQGTSGILKTTLVGAVMSLLTWASGSLVPAMVLHVAIDAINGRMAYLLIRTESEDEPAVDTPFEPEHDERDDD